MGKITLFMRKKITLKNAYIADWHRHHFWQMEKTDKTLKVNVEEKSYTVPQYSILLIPPFVEHRISYPEETSIESIKFDFASELLFADTIEILNSKQNLALDMLFEQIPYQENSYYSQLVNLYLEIFILTFYKEKFDVPDQYMNISDNLIRKVVVYMNDHLFNDLPLDHFANLVGLSKNHFIRRFKSEMSCTPLEYVRKIKIERAISLIKDTDLNISQIADLLHYSSLYSFSRSFKKIAGVSPSQKIRQLRIKN